MRRLALVAFLLLAACSGAARAPYDAAETALADYDFTRAVKLFHQAMTSDADPDRRNRAAAQAAHLEWAILGDDAAAERTLANRTDADALTERARRELRRGDFARARATALDALRLATRRELRVRAAVTAAHAVTLPLQQARRAGRCTNDPALTETIAMLRAPIERDGPFLDLTHALLDVALLAGDGATALDAWRWYYGVTPGAPPPNAIASAAATLAAELPAFRGSASSAAQRRTIGLALAGTRFFDEAADVLHDPCASDRIDDGESNAVVAYAAALRAVANATEAHYRRVARGARGQDELRDALVAEQKKLGLTPDELAHRYGLYANLGKTGGVPDLHLGHIIVDENRDVQQYGRGARLRFLALDAMVSNGFLEWATDGDNGDGGWQNETGIYQVRPAYADGAIAEWLAVTDPAARAERAKNVADQTRRDDELARTTPIAPFPGLAARLRMQANDELLAELHAKGLAGDALRDAFLARVRDDVFASSIWAHEGRHAIDHKYDHLDDSEELEFRAKLSEVALAPSPRRALSGGILGGGVGANTPHGKANHRIGEGLVAWMKAHAREIAGLDAAKPLLPQLDKLTDAQLRAAIRSMDPLAAR
ncbi:MAG: hypothetical protein JO197_08445 [Acidobacteria bacterium]|nr:hypothetical protein [Acidobacteriota bacterium]MBV9474649.1 hypothetical protein [Acidobacteriota bacterium]